MRPFFSFLAGLVRGFFAFFADLFRNRRNRACTACVVVFFAWTVFWSVWGVLSLVHGTLLPVPHSLLAALSIVSGWKGWKDHVDARYPAHTPPPPAAP